MRPHSNAARSLRGLWLLGKGDRAGLSAFGASRLAVARSFMAIVWSAPAIAAYLLLERWQFLGDMPDAELSDGDYYWRAVLAEALRLAVMPIVVAGCVKLLRLTIPASSMVIVTNWLLVPGHYLAASLIYASYLLDDGNTGRKVASFAILVIGALVLLTWSWNVLKTASSARHWQIACFLGITSVVENLLMTVVQSYLGISISYA